jgi:hypothetical protein
MKLEGMLSDTLAALLTEVEEIFEDISTPEVAHVFEEWKDRLS